MQNEALIWDMCLVIISYVIHGTINMRIYSYVTSEKRG
jgi:hypothetical protein